MNLPKKMSVKEEGGRTDYVIYETLHRIKNKVEGFMRLV